MDTLVLNADGQPVSILPISTVRWQDAVLYMYTDKCRVMEWYDDWMVRSVSWETKVPAVIMLKSYLQRSTSVRFSKYNVFLRDEYECQYCHTGINNKTGTLDHVIPLSKGGKTSWTNIVTACQACNYKKSNKSIMKPTYTPYKPGYYELIRKRKKFEFHIKHPSWNTWLGLDEHLEQEKNG